MSPSASFSPDDRLFFGPFELRPAERRLLCEGAPVALGGRAMDLLLCLLERSGEVVSAEALLDGAWRGLHVEPAALRVQIRALRKALGGRRGEEGYIVNVAGHGYQFAAPVRRPATASNRPAAGQPALPPVLPRMIGRDAAVEDLAHAARSSRLVTVVGAGGVGKTTVALAAAHRLSPAFEGDVAFVDLAIESRDANVAPAIAAALALPGIDGDPLAHLVAQLRRRRLLLVLDSCERVIVGAAAVVEALRQEAPDVYVVATSREPLGTPGEHLHRLEGLTPPPARVRAFDETCAYPAAQLFVERVLASGGQIDCGPVAAALVGDICRKLDGLPLAIELAAGQVVAFGLAATRALLDHRLRLGWLGRRTAPPRHLSLNATLDWSYDLLRAEDAATLRALSIFVGAFTHEDAAAIVDPRDLGGLPQRLESLTAKSLLAAVGDGAPIQYRLPDATRDYARLKLDLADEARPTAARHAAWILHVLSGRQAQPGARPMRDWMADFAHRIQDAQAALDVALSVMGDPALVTPLTLAAAPIWTRLGRAKEARDRVEAALTVVAPDSREAMALHIALVGALLEISPHDLSRARAACDRALDLADNFDDDTTRLHAWWARWNTHVSETPYVPQAYAAARRYRALASALADPFAVMIGERMIGVTELLRGDFAAAHAALDRAKTTSPAWDLRARLAWHADDPDVMTGNMLVGLNWLSGRPEAATAMAREVLERAEATGNLSIQAMVLADSCGALGACVGDMATVGRCATQLEACVAGGAPASYGTWVRVLRAIVAAERGDPEPGSALVSGGLPPECNHPRFASVLADLARRLAASGAADAARALTDQLSQRIERSGERWIWSEVQRLRGELMDETDSAVALFESAFDLALRQGAQSYALRAATSLARRQPSSAPGVLAPLLASFNEGAATQDQVEARAVLEACGF